MLKLYHLTTYKELELMLKHGLKKMDPPKFCTDGELGRGFYLVARLPDYRKDISLLVEADVRDYAHVPRPSDPDPKTEEGKLFHGLAFDEKRGLLAGGTGVSEIERRIIGDRIRKEFVKRGYKGIMADNGVFVVFDGSTIKIVDTIGVS